MPFALVQVWPRRVVQGRRTAPCELAIRALTPGDRARTARPRGWPRSSAAASPPGSRAGARRCVHGRSTCARPLERRAWPRRLAGSSQDHCESSRHRAGAREPAGVSCRSSDACSRHGYAPSRAAQRVRRDRGGDPLRPHRGARASPGPKARENGAVRALEPSRRRRPGRTICGVPDTSDQSDSTTRVAEALRRRANDWAAGAQEGRELDRRIAREQSPQERLDSGCELVELAAKLRRPD
jgi:hypothetical protein